MLHATPARTLRRIGFRVVAAGALAASLAAVWMVVSRVQHGSSPTSPPPAAPGPWSVQQAGYRLLGLPPAQALRRARVRVPAPLAAPAGIYAGAHSMRLRYDRTSRYGAFLLTVYTRRASLTARAVRGLASGCGDCSANRVVRLGGGVRGALRAGAGGQSSITWRQHRRAFEVRGPAATFTTAHAVAAARSIARANA